MKIRTVFSIHTASCTHIIRNMYRNALKHTVKETDSHVSVAVNPAHVQEYSHIRMSNGICGYFLKHLAQTIHFQVIMLISSATPRLQWNQLYANHITHQNHRQLNIFQSFTVRVWLHTYEIHRLLVDSLSFCLFHSIHRLCEFNRQLLSWVSVHYIDFIFKI